MNRIDVKTGRPYSVEVEAGLLSRAGERMAGLCGRSRPRLAIVTDDRVAGYYLGPVKASLEDAGFTCSAFIFPHGEKSKNLDTVRQVYSFFAESGITRSDMAVALGGGVAGDLTGFAAATWLRGISFVQIPTSLLAMIDSSVGGKTGVDLPQGKNLAGAFWQPSLVLCDPLALKTLPPQYLCDGTAEAIKYGAILDESLFALLENGERDERMEELICRCIDWKRIVVEQDERDKGVRQWLNFGHTLGHAVEKYTNYTISHGCAVAIGMVLLTGAFEQAGLTPVGTAQRICACCKRYGLPVTTDAPLEALCAFCMGDKKRDGNSLTLVGLEKLGKAMLYPIEAEALPGFLRGDAS